jgi:hypothetical protein
LFWQHQRNGAASSTPFVSLLPIHSDSDGLKNSKTRARFLDEKHYPYDCTTFELYLLSSACARI